MPLEIENLRIKAEALNQFIEDNFAIYQKGTLVTIEDLTSSEHEQVTLFIHQLDEGIQGFIQVDPKFGYDPFYFSIPLNDLYQFDLGAYSLSLLFYPFDYCEEEAEYPVELAVYLPHEDRTISIEISLNGKVRFFGQSETSIAR